MWTGEGAPLYRRAECGRDIARKFHLRNTENENVITGPGMHVDMENAGILLLAYFIVFFFPPMLMFFVVLDKC